MGLSFADVVRVNGVAMCVTIAVLTAVLFRVAIGLGPHSGEGVHPMYGDYEAQRHWLEITANLPVSDWYRNTTDNDLMYWGLDYPPVTAYHAWAMAQVYRWAAKSDYTRFLVGGDGEPDMTALHTSRGHETPSGKRFMRWTVIVGDAFYIAPLVYLAIRWGGLQVKSARRDVSLALLFCALVHPALLAVDHRHFQYNGISLGLALFSMALFGTGADYAGCFAFVASVFYKQMGLYYAPAVFGFLLTRGAHHSGGVTLRSFASLPALLAAAVLSVALVLSPLVYFARESGPWHATLGDMIVRLFPFDRGLYEDKVPSFWCAVSPVWKLKSWDRGAQKAVTAAATVVASGIAAAGGFRAVRARKMRVGASAVRDGDDLATLLLASSASAMAFFLFSFHVHEKQCLLFVVPMAALAMIRSERQRQYIVLSAFATFAGLFGMAGLMAKDNALLATTGASVAFFTVLWWAWSETDGDVAIDGPLPAIAVPLSCAAPLLIFIGRLLIPPPSSLPHIYELLIAAHSCMCICIAYIALNYEIWFNLGTRTDTTRTRTRTKTKTN